MAKLAISGRGGGRGQAGKRPVVVVVVRLDIEARQPQGGAADEQRGDASTPPRCGRCVNCGHIFTSRIAGATPNDTTSHRLSSWAPKSLVVAREPGDLAVERVEDHGEQRSARRKA